LGVVEGDVGGFEGAIGEEFDFGDLVVEVGLDGVGKSGFELGEVGFFDA
jgi:hypothetical protein